MFSGVGFLMCILPLAAAVVLALSGRKYFAAIAAAVSLGAADMWIHTPSEEMLSQLHESTYAECDILSVHETESARRITAIVRKTGIDSTGLHETAPLKVRVYVPSFLPVITPGDRVLFKCDFTPRSYIEHVPRQLNTAGILARQGIWAQATAKPENIIRVETSAAWRMKFVSLREHISSLILRSRLSGATKEFLVTTVIGNPEYLDREVRDSFASAGIAHVLALSGLHVGILAAFCSLLFLPLRLSSRLRRALPLCMIAVLWLFAAVTGMSPSVTRAVIMATVLIGAGLMQRRHSPWNSLCLAALLILAFDPGALLSVSFQLSFAAVAGILAFGNALNPVSRAHPQYHSLAGLLAMSAGAMLATALPSMWYFHRLPVWFLLANVLTVPLLTPLVGGGMLLVLLESAGVHCDTLCHILDAIYNGVQGIASACDSLPASHIDGIYLPLPVLLSGIAAVALLAAAIHLRKRAYAIMTSVCALGSVAVYAATPAANPNGVYIAPSTYHTDIIVSSATGLDIITTAPANEHSGIAASARIVYSDFMLERGIDTVGVATGDINTEYVHYNYPVLTAGKKTLYIATGKNIIAKSAVNADYVLVCRGYTGTISALSDKVRARSIILSGDLHPSRHNKYADECVSLGIEYISLKNQSAGNLLAAD